MTDGGAIRSQKVHLQLNTRSPLLFCYYYCFYLPISLPLYSTCILCQLSAILAISAIRLICISTCRLFRMMWWNISTFSSSCPPHTQYKVICPLRMFSSFSCFYAYSIVSHAEYDDGVTENKNGLKFGTRRQKRLRNGDRWAKCNCKMSIQNSTSQLLTERLYYVLRSTPYQESGFVMWICVVRRTGFSIVPFWKRMSKQADGTLRKLLSICHQEEEGKQLHFGCVPGRRFASTATQESHRPDWLSCKKYESYAQPYTWWQTHIQVVKSNQLWSWLKLLWVTCLGRRRQNSRTKKCKAVSILVLSTLYSFWYKPPAIKRKEK